MSNSLIFGKNPKERIVAINANESEAILYVQDEDGSIRHDIVPNKFWFLSNERLNDKAVRLNGELHYKWGYQFSDKTSFMKTRSHFSKSKDIFTIYNAEEALMTKDGYTLFKGMKTSDLSVLSFDIETTGTVMDETSNVLLIANTFRDSQGNVTRKMFAYNDYENQGKMIRDWCVWVCAVDPTIVCGHNINIFDIPYIKLVADRYDVSLDLGRDGSALKVAGNESKFRKEGGQFINYKKNNIIGRHIVDTFFLAIRYDAASRKYDSYGLKYIINAEGLEAKDRQFYDASKIKDNYQIPEEWEKIKRYAERDGDDSLALYDLMIPATFYWSQMIPKTIQVITEGATGAQINSLLVRSYIQDKHSIPKASEIRDFEGAISKGNPGIYSNCWKTDAVSLYPSIILQYEIYDKDKDPNGNFLKMVQTLREERLKNKKLAKETKLQFYTDLEQSQKIGINSSYGTLGASGLNFNSIVNADLVTQKGREILTKAINWAENKNFKLINCDTDSTMVSKHDETVFTESEQRELLIDLNSNFPEYIRFEPDGYFKKVIIVKAKNYVLWDEKKLKVKGSSLVATSKSPAMKEFIKSIIQTILDEKYDYLTIYNLYVKEILDVKDMKRFSVRKTLTEKVFAAERTSEAKLLSAVEDSENEMRQGDKAYVFYREDNSLCLVENFDGNYNKTRLLKNLYDTALCFSTIVPKEMFINYSLKRNQKLLSEIT